MENVKFIEVNSFGEIIEHAIISREDGSELSMTKATYDEMIEKAANVNLS